MRRGLIATSLALLALGAWIEIRAEVRAITSRVGEYQMTRVLTSRNISRNASNVTGPSGIWRPLGRGAGAHTLNPTGDSNGDLWPTIAENSVEPHHAWVVWSRPYQSRYELVWSRWLGTGWDEIRWVLDEISAGDDLDADIDFDSEGRPFMVWWRDGLGDQTVYLSLFLETRWMEPFQVSPEFVNARYPDVTVINNTTVLVKYEVGYGDDVREVNQTVLFNRPVTITDDINPLDFSEGDRDVQQINN